MRSVTKEIDGKSVTLTTFPVLAAQSLLLEIAQLVGPSAASLMNDAKKPGFLTSDAIPHIVRLLTTIDPKKFESIIGVLLSRCTVSFESAEGKRVKVDLDSPIKIDQAFGDSVLVMYKTIVFVMEANYSNFLDELGPLLAVEAG